MKGEPTRRVYLRSIIRVVMLTRRGRSPAGETVAADRNTMANSTMGRVRSTIAFAQPAVLSLPGTPLVLVLTAPTQRIRFNYHGCTAPIWVIGVPSDSGIVPKFKNTGVSGGLRGHRRA